MHCRIANIASYLPERILTNSDLEKEFSDFNAAKIEKKIGIRERHIAAPGETALDLAEKAVLRLFEKCPECRKKIDFILFCTQSPDYKLPTTACLLQNRLGLPTGIGALDYNLGCSGYIYGLALAKGLISVGVSLNVLLVTAETYSHYLNPTDKGNRSIFGDGAAATWIEASEEKHFGEFVLGTDGAGAENLIIKNGGARFPYDPTVPQDAACDGNNLFMNGPAIFNFTLESLPPLIRKVLQNNEMMIDSIDYIIFHQANRYMLKTLATLIQLPEDKFHIDLLNSANTVSSTIPIALEQTYMAAKIKKGNRVLLAGFGVGYSYGATIITL